MRHRGCSLGARAHVGDERCERSPAGQAELAADEIRGLDAVRAFVDRRDAGVAEELGGTRLFDIAHAAMDLHAERRDFVADVGGMGLGKRRQQLQPVARGCVAQRGAIDLSRCIIDERADGLGLRSHAQQHPANIGVIGDWHSTARWDVARAARQQNPGILVIYMMGDSGADWVSEGTLKSVIVQKPFSLTRMLNAVANLSNTVVQPRHDALASF